MKVGDARAIASLVIQQDRYNKILNLLSVGYKDEWVIKNSHTGTEVKLSSDEWLEINSIIQEKYNKVTKEIDAY